MRIRTIVSFFALFVLLSSNSFSQYLAIESFDYPAGTSMDTLEANGGTGWAGPWDLFEGNTDVMTVADSGLAYDDLIYQVPRTGRFIIGANPIAWQFQRYGRNLAQRWPNEAGKVYWLSAFYQLTDFTTNGWALVGFYDGNQEKAGMGHEWGNDSLGLAVYNPAGHTSYLANDGAQWLVTKVVMSGDSLSNAYLWVTPDPTGGEPDTNAADAKGRWNLVDGFDRVAVHWGGEGVGMTMAVDEIRLGESWTDVSSPLTAVEGNDGQLPGKFSLAQNYPNPFNPSTKIQYTLGDAGNIRLSVFDILGREIAVLVNGNQSAGDHEVVFSADNFSTGVYLYKLQTETSVITKKMSLLK